MTTNRTRWNRRLIWLAVFVAALFLSTNPPFAPAVGINAVVVGNPGTQNYAEFDTVSLQMDSEFENYLGPGEAYAALVSTGYVHRVNGWKMMFHSQTPLEPAAKN